VGSGVDRRLTEHWMFSARAIRRQERTRECDCSASELDSKGASAECENVGTVTLTSPPLPSSALSR
jgi:hypothetical protein